MHRFLCLSLFFLFGVAAPAETLYQVNFKAVTAWGEPLPLRVTALNDPVHHRDLAANCIGQVCKDLAQGAYTYSIVLSGNGRKLDGTAVIYRANQMVIVDAGNLGEDLDEATFQTVSGKIAGASDPSSLWVRLQPLYSDTPVSSRVNADGSFSIEDVRPGNWMLLVLSEGELLHFEPFRCQNGQNRPLSITLKTPAKRPPARAPQP
jgi:hypothetical protein